MKEKEFILIKGMYEDIQVKKFIEEAVRKTKDGIEVTVSIA